MPEARGPMSFLHLHDKYEMMDDVDIITKASEASWSYSCDSKVFFDRVQILTPDFSGRSPPPLTLTLTLSLSLSLSLSSLSLSSLFSLSLSLSSLFLVFPSLFSLFSRRRIRAKSHMGV